MPGPPRVTYSSKDDLLIGDLPCSTELKDKHVDDASNEIDSKLGFLYTVPFTASAVSIPGWILIKRIANNLASGRLLLEVNQSREPGSMGYQNGPVKVVSYGQSLIDEAEATLTMILKGDIDLHPPVENNGDDGGLGFLHGARVANTDSYSQVEAFYGWAAQRQPYQPGFGWPFLPGQFGR